MMMVVVVESGLLRGYHHHLGHSDHPSKDNRRRIDASLSTEMRAQRHSKLHFLPEPSSQCLEDPDAPECLHQRRSWWSTLFDFPEAELDIFSPSHHGLPKRKEEISQQGPSSFISNHNYYYYNEDEVVSSSPTRDLCYGNMERLAYKKFCHSEMPSVSLEPSEQPTTSPHRDPEGETWNNHSPTNAPSMIPSPSPTHGLTRHPHDSDRIPTDVPRIGIGMCDGDCNTPSDCEEGLYCFQRMNFEAVPGCPGTELDGSRTDYCTNSTIPTSEMPLPPPPPTNDSFRLKLYWNHSYWWQDSNEEIEWCMTCPHRPGSTRPSCQEGDILFLHYCSSDSVFFHFESEIDEEINMIQVVGTELCIERHGTSVTLEVCHPTNSLQHWVPPQGDMILDASFEIGQRPQHSSDLCLTTHHHPKLGEEIELFPCPIARQDNSSLWVMF